MTNPTIRRSTLAGLSCAALLGIATLSGCTSSETARAIDLKEREVATLKDELSSVKSEAVKLRENAGASADKAIRVSELEDQVAFLAQRLKAATEDLGGLKDRARSEQATGWDKAAGMLESTGASLLNNLGVPGGALIASIGAQVLAAIATAKRQRKESK